MRASADEGYLWPVASESWKLEQGWTGSNEKTNHGGQDISGALDTPIVATKSGTVVKVLDRDEEHWGGYGNGVIIQHADGLYSHYAHMNYTCVSEGQNVC